MGGWAIARIIWEPRGNNLATCILQHSPTVNKSYRELYGILVWWIVDSLWAPCALQPPWRLHPEFLAQEIDISKAILSFSTCWRSPRMHLLQKKLLSKGYCQECFEQHRVYGEQCHTESLHAHANSCQLSRKEKMGRPGQYVIPHPWPRQSLYHLGISSPNTN